MNHEELLTMYKETEERLLKELDICRKLIKIIEHDKANPEATNL